MIWVEGDVKGVEFLVDVFKEVGEGFVVFRKMEVVEEIVDKLFCLRNVVYFFYG